MVSRFCGLILKINFHNIKYIIRYNGVEGRNPFLRKIAFGLKRKEILKKILIKKSLYKIDIFQICMKYFLDLSLLQRYITLEDNQYFQQFF